MPASILHSGCELAVTVTMATAAPSSAPRNKTSQYIFFLPPTFFCPRRRHIKAASHANPREGNTFFWRVLPSVRRILLRCELRGGRVQVSTPLSEMTHFMAAVKKEGNLAVCVLGTCCSFTSSASYSTSLAVICLQRWAAGRAV